MNETKITIKLIRNAYAVDEGDACDWERPANIIRLEPWTDVTGKVIVEL